MKAKYKHDCDNCKFLTSLINEGQNYDLYFCDGGDNGTKTVIARFGVDGDYYSGLDFVSYKLRDAICNQDQDPNDILIQLFCSEESNSIKLLMMAASIAINNGLLDKYFYDNKRKKDLKL